MMRMQDIRIEEVTLKNIEHALIVLVYVKLAPTNTKKHKEFIALGKQA